jgi:hypothetical protein
MNQKVPVWGNVIPFINAGRKLSDSLREKTRKLVVQSNSHLSPFQDPLSLDFSSNRWFAGKREENYSDWLKWIIEQLDDPNLVFRLLEINVPSVAEKCHKEPPEALREYPVQKGHDDQSGRLDILIRYSHEALVVIEVKLDNAESADIEKNRGYYKSVEEKFEETKYKYYKLLVINAEESKYNNFEVLKWKSVCMELRRMVADKSVKAPLVGALMLAFAGAVEQNLLGLSSIKSYRFHSETITYLQNTLPRGGTMDSGEDTQMRHFMEEGFSNYLGALYAIEEFRKKIRDRIKKKIDSKRNELNKAMGTSLPEPSNEDNGEEIVLGGKLYRIGWIIGSFDDNSPIDKIYVCMSFDSSDPKGRKRVSMSFYVNRNFDYFLKQCETVSPDFQEWDQKKEMGILVDLTDLDSLENKLNEVMNKWIEVWERIEGMPGLVNMKA